MVFSFSERQEGQEISENLDRVLNNSDALIR